jgi:ATP-dependent Clp protease ATP-binding subunit ClpC
VLALAYKEAVRLNHDLVGTEHVLLGILKSDAGPAIKLLGKLGLDLAKVYPTRVTR